MHTGSKGNGYRRLYWIDRFARKFYCTHARLNALRSDKRRSKRLVRRTGKAECAAERENWPYCPRS